MKTPHLLASFAVAATAAAAELKDPADVAREWNYTVVAPASVTDNLSLRAPLVQPSPFVGTRTLPLIRDKSKDAFNVPPWGKSAPRGQPAPPFPLIDAPSYRIPDPLPNDLPRGAKPWEYGGQKYWIVPLIPSRER